MQCTGCRDAGVVVLVVAPSDSNTALRSHGTTGSPLRIQLCECIRRKLAALEMTVNLKGLN